ncbi:hypothetical protein, variant [Aphanomyces astaci]|nr:hypothetical protein, variant [Aphanomyces astaci]ETV77583.1 hypothetical protein, variant [Aphanomyces astaci]|eukprot:XP_009832693.1 hypothetical protein, variant [Aphanomyces astaci]
MWKVASNAHGHVAVIDGCHVNVTLCDRALVPPPMSAARVQFAHAINEVLVLADGSIVAQDFRGNWSRSQQLHAPPQAIPLTLKDGRSVDTMALRYVQVVDTSTIAGISTLYASQVVTMNVETGTLETTDYHEVVSTISNDGCHIQLSQSKAIWPQGVVQLSNGHTLWTEWEVVQCSTVVVQLAQTKLFVNNTLLHASVASFHVIPTLGYLALTTLGAKSEFRLYPLDALRQGTFVPEHTRPMERGATVVTSAHTTVVLQMERGNVEAIAPRPLLLALLQSKLVAHEFASALELCRKHRIDMNVLVDFDPTSFLSHLPQWIQAIPKRVRIDRLCLFITTVHPTDVCATKFPSLAGLNLLTETWDKVTRVCRAIRSTLVELDPDFYLLPLLTCDAKLLELDTALLRLQSLHGQNPTGAQHGLKHLTFLVDVDQLYDVALGLYDLPLTLLVAKHTQRDPKEYTSQLSAFQALEASHSSSYLRYAIDMSLHRYELALRHLHAAGPSYHSECVELVKSHHLYDVGLTLFPSASLLRTPIVSAYGRHLTAQAKYTQAGYTFLSIRAFEDAIEAFKRAQEWHMALALVPQVPSFNMASVAYALAEELVNRNELKDAARIYIEYCQDVDEGIATLLLGRYYADALHMALLHNRSDLVETDVHPAVEQAAVDVEEEYEAKLESFQTHWTRLTTLRDQIRLFRLHGIDGKAAADDDDGAKDSASSAAASALSQSSSVSSVGSHNSNRDIKFGSLSVTSLAITSSYNHGRASTTSSTSPSSTMKKKMPRRFRRCKIQQGSAEEDAYVLQSLVAAVPSADDLGHVRRVMQVLLYFGHVQQVTSIQRTIQRCLTHMAAHPLPPPVHGDAVPFDVPPVDESWLVLPLSM